jgi:hypothetical protein
MAAQERSIGWGSNICALEPPELGFKLRSPPFFHRLQPGGDRYKRRFGVADRRLRIGLQRQQEMLARPKTVSVQPLANLRQPRLALSRPFCRGSDATNAANALGLRQRRIAPKPTRALPRNSRVENNTGTLHPVRRLGARARDLDQRPALVRIHRRCNNPSRSYHGSPLPCHAIHTAYGADRISSTTS